MNEKQNELVWPDNVVADRHEVTGKWVMWYLTDEQARICSDALQAGNDITFHKIKQALVETEVEDGQFDREVPPNPYVVTLSELLPDHSIDKLVAAVIGIVDVKNMYNYTSCDPKDKQITELTQQVKDYEQQVYVLCDKEEKQSEQIRILREGLEKINDIANAVKKGDIIKQPAVLYETIANEALAQADKIAGGV